MAQILNRQNDPYLAYNLYVPDEKNCDLTPIVFLGGFRSDMQGTKAMYLENKCKKEGRTYLRFDYRGHGESGGEFDESTLTDWLKDVTDIIKYCIDKPVLMVGSSMGGWLSLLYTRDNPEKIVALVGLAAAPDFTQWMRTGMLDHHKAEMSEKGYFLLENDYGDPYSISKSLLDDGDQNLLLDKEINIECPVTLIQGKKDADVPWQTAEEINTRLKGLQNKIVYIDEADHRLSAPDELEVLNQVIDRLLAMK